LKGNGRHGRVARPGFPSRRVPERGVDAHERLEPQVAVEPVKVAGPGPVNDGGISADAPPLCGRGTFAVVTPESIQWQRRTYMRSTHPLNRNVERTEPFARIQPIAIRPPLLFDALPHAARDDTDQRLQNPTGESYPQEVENDEGNRRACRGARHPPIHVQPAHKAVDPLPNRVEYSPTESSGLLIRRPAGCERKQHIPRDDRSLNCGTVPSVVAQCGCFFEGWGRYGMHHVLAICECTVVDRWAEHIDSTDQDAQGR